jgi:hypothetical protein
MPTRQPPHAAPSGPGGFLLGEDGGASLGFTSRGWSTSPIQGRAFGRMSRHISAMGSATSTASAARYSPDLTGSGKGTVVRHVLGEPSFPLRYVKEYSETFLQDYRTGRLVVPAAPLPR